MQGDMVIYCRKAALISLKEHLTNVGLISMMRYKYMFVCNFFTCKFRKYFKDNSEYAKI